MDLSEFRYELEAALKRPEEWFYPDIDELGKFRSYLQHQTTGITLHFGLVLKTSGYPSGHMDILLNPEYAETTPIKVVGPNHEHLGTVTAQQVLGLFQAILALAERKREEESLARTTRFLRGFKGFR